MTIRTRNAADHKESGPPPLTRGVTRSVRFEETDPMGLVWHGRYPGYFEDARVMLGNSLGIGYLDFYAAGFVLPVTRMHIDYKRPLRYGDTFVITASLVYTPAARLHTEYVLTRNGGIVCTGHTIQHFTTKEGALCIARPAMYDAFCIRWLRGELTAELPPFARFSPEIPSS